MVKGRRWKVLSDNNPEFFWGWLWQYSSCKVYALHDFVYQVRLQNIDLNVGEGLNSDDNLVVENPLILNTKLESYLCNCLVDWCIDWGGKYDIFHVDDEDDFMLVEHSVVHPGLYESGFF